MDHLLIPSNPEHDRIEVPLRVRDAYNGPFQSFATRHGWDMSQLVSRDLSNDQIAAVKCLLQTWLFFGLLEEVFGSGYTARYEAQRPSPFVSPGNGCIVTQNQSHHTCPNLLSIVLFTCPPACFCTRPSSIHLHSSNKSRESESH